MCSWSVAAVFVVVGVADGVFAGVLTVVADVVGVVAAGWGGSGCGGRGCGCGVGGVGGGGGGGCGCVGGCGGGDVGGGVGGGGCGSDGGGGGGADDAADAWGWGWGGGGGGGSMLVRLFCGEMVRMSTQQADELPLVALSVAEGSISRCCAGPAQGCQGTLPLIIPVWQYGSIEGAITQPLVR